MTSSNSLIDVGKLAEPINTLVIKIANAIGVVYEPIRITRKANAEAKANEIMALSNQKVLDIQNRALSRFVHEETRKQENIESVIELALPQISNHANTHDVSDDWLVKFFEHVKLVSDQDMQVLWAKILAGESNAPGTFTKKTLNIVAELEKDDAILFSNLCKFSVEKIGPLVFSSDDALSNKYGLDFVSLHHLEDLGLIKFGPVDGFVFTELSQVEQFNYFEEKFQLKFNKEENNALNIGIVMLSKEGRQLIPICNATPETEIFEYIINKIKSEKIIVELLNGA